MAVRQSSTRPTVDGFGVVASSVCAVHCGVSALLPGAAAAVGAGASLGHEMEWILAVAAIGFALLAIVTGIRRHRGRTPAAFLGAGIAALVLARLCEDMGMVAAGTGVSILAAISLVVGHVTNHRRTKRCTAAAGASTPHACH